MSLLNMLIQGQGGTGVSALGEALGLDARTTQSLAEQFAPAIAAGTKRRAAQEGGLGAVLGALKGEGQAALFDDPSAAAAPDARAGGEEFLAEIFGDRGASSELAEAAAARSGASTEEAAAFLPALAAMLQGGLQKQVPDAEIDQTLQGLTASDGDRAGAGLGDLLGGLGGGGGLLGSVLGAMGGGRAPSGGLGAVLSMLDADGDGSPLDDVVGKFLR